MRALRLGPGPATVVALLALALTGCGSESPQDRGAAGTAEEGAAAVRVQGPEPAIAVPNAPPPKRLVVRQLRAGKGPRVAVGDEAVTQFVAVRYVNGETFESSWEPGRRPFSFELGADEASPGFEAGVKGMRIGSRRELTIPPHLISRYGVPPGTGPEATLIYVVDLLDIRPGEPASRNGFGGRSEPEVRVPAGAPPSRLVTNDLIEGRGHAAGAGDELTVEYVGIYYSGRQFTNSWERAKPFRFRLGSDDIRVSPGWELGLRGMRAGGRRQLIIPPRLLQRGGAPPGSSPRDGLIYVVDLVAVRH